MLEKWFFNIFHFYSLTEYPLLATAGKKIENSMELWTNSKKKIPVICIDNLVMCTDNF